MIIVACTKRDPKMFTAQKYDNDEPWNVAGGTAPNGVHATRYLRNTEPNKSMLSPLALFLVENCPGCVAGTMPHPRADANVRCYNGKTYEWGGEVCEEHIKSWLFSVADPDRNDEYYWNCEAGKMLAAGVNRVVIGNAEWRI